MHYLPIAQTLVGPLCADEPYIFSDKARVVIFLKLFIIIWGQTKSMLESAWHWQKDSFLSFIFYFDFSAKSVGPLLCPAQFADYLTCKLPNP